MLLERGAAHVVAVDVGHGQLDPALAADPRVTLLEGLNARDLTAAHLGGRQIGAVVADLSFISLKLALPPALALAEPGAWGVFLVKPQFEVGRAHVGKGGIVRDPAVARAGGRRHRRVARRRAGLARRRPPPLPDRRRRRQPGIPARRAAMAEIVTIEALGHRGDGIARGPDGPVYVPFALPGERVAIEREGERGRLVEILEPSPRARRAGLPAFRHAAAAARCRCCRSRRRAG